MGSNQMMSGVPMSGMQMSNAQMGMQMSNAQMGMGGSNVGMNTGNFPMNYPINQGQGMMDPRFVGSNTPLNG